MSNERTYVPDVTPTGKPVNLGVVVATPAFTGGTAQQWMCAAVVPVVRPAKTTSTVIWLVAVSHVTIAFPLPDEATGGFSLLGLRAAVNTTTVSLQPATEPTGVQLLGLLPVTWVLLTEIEPNGAPNGENCAIPPPATDAVFPVTSTLFIVSVGKGGVAPGNGMPCRFAFAIPAPMPALLPVTVTLFSVAAAWLSRPPPTPPSASLPVSRTLFICNVPPFEMPAPPGSCPPVALLSLIPALLIVMKLPAPPPLPLPLAMPPPPEAVL